MTVQNLAQNFAKVTGNNPVLVIRRTLAGAYWCGHKAGAS
jgi:hypothetical protein